MKNGDISMKYVNWTKNFAALIIPLSNDIFRNLRASLRLKCWLVSCHLCLEIVNRLGVEINFLTVEGVLKFFFLFSKPLVNCWWIYFNAWQAFASLSANFTSILDILGLLVVNDIMTWLLVNRQTMVILGLVHLLQLLVRHISGQDLQSLTLN